MSDLVKMLSQSRLAGVIEAIEKGEDVDYRRVQTLQTLDIARAGEIFAVEALEREVKSDDDYESLPT